MCGLDLVREPSYHMMYFDIVSQDFQTREHISIGGVYDSSTSGGGNSIQFSIGCVVLPDRHWALLF